MTLAPRASSSATSTRLGASRMSSVLGLNASPRGEIQAFQVGAETLQDFAANLFLRGVGPLHRIEISRFIPASPACISACTSLESRSRRASPRPGTKMVADADRADAATHALDVRAQPLRQVAARS